MLDLCLNIIDSTFRARDFLGSELVPDSTLLPTLCKIMQVVSVKAVWLIARYQKLLQLCKQFEITFLSPSFKELESTSPSIISSVFTPDGSYSMGFWLFIPSASSWDEGAQIHILSRIPENGDCNLVAK